MTVDKPCACNCEDPCSRGFSCDDACDCFPCAVCHPSYFEDESQ